jgi:hypothetical protein
LHGVRERLSAAGSQDIQQRLDYELILHMPA